MTNTQPLTQLEFTDADHDAAEDLARRLGYAQTAYTSTSALWGLFCLNENPATWRGAPRALQSGCIIKTRELGLLFVQDLEDLQRLPRPATPISDEHNRIKTRKARP